MKTELYTGRKSEQTISARKEKIKKEIFYAKNR